MKALLVCNPRLYHFLNKKYGVQALERKRLKVSLPNSLNDPFDHRAVETHSKAQRQALNEAINGLSEVCGLLCFSPSYESPVMWAHYAERHKGICLGFDVPVAKVVTVEYVHELLEGEFSADFEVWPTERKLVDALVKTKHIGWGYEDERRTFVSLSESINEGGLFFTPFSEELILKEVIVGVNSDLSRKQIRNALQSHNIKPDCFKVRAAFHSFKMTRNELDRMWK